VLWVGHLIGSLLAGVLMAQLLNQPYVDAGLAARDVGQGKPVEPIQYQPFPWWEWSYPISILAIHADPATVEPAGKPDDSPAAERLQHHHLLYLGQTNGTVVLYDATAQRADYLPASAIILHVANCDARPPSDPACESG